MKTCKRVAKSAVLAIVLFASILVSIPRSYALAEFILGQALGILQSAVTDAAERNAAKMVLRHSWSDNTYSSTSHLLEVSGDELMSYVATMNSGGNPAEIVYTSSVGGTGVSGYWIVAKAEPFYINSSGYSRIDADVTYTGRHYGIFNISQTYNAEYYVYAKTLNSNSLLDSIKSRIDSIWNWGQAGGLLTTINTSLSDIARITAALNTAFNTYSSAVTTWLSNKSQEITNIANRLVVTRDGTQYAITTLVSWIYDSFYITRSDTGRTGFTAISNWIYNELSGNINTRLTAIQTATSNTANRLVFTRSDGDYSLANLTSHIWDSVDGVESTLTTISSRVNTTNSRLSTIITNTANTANRLVFTRSDGDYSLAHLTSMIYDTLDKSLNHTHMYYGYAAATPTGNYTLSRTAVDFMLGYLNTECVGKPITRWISATEFSEGSILDSAALGTGDVITLRVMGSSGTYYYGTLRSREGKTYTAAPASSSVFDDSNIVAAIDRIYDWLDNADLATNSTIVQLVTDYTSEVNNAITHSSKILDLFGYSYTEVDDGFTNSDWADAKDYFAQYKG